MGEYLWTIVLTIIAIFILLFFFNEQICTAIKNLKGRLTNVKEPFNIFRSEQEEEDTTIESDFMNDIYSFNEEDPQEYNVEETENININKDKMKKIHWNEYVQDMILDPAVKSNHSEFVKDISKFYLGSRIGQVSDESRSFAAMNFRGLRRPEYVKIGDDVRQQLDVDTNILKRNKKFTV
jgi:Sec-independent protein translocase protein TatA